MNKFVLCFAVFCCIQYGCAFLTPDKLGPHMNKVRKSVHNNCKVLTGATEDQIDQLREGNFDQGDEVKNYATCAWLQARTINNKFELDPSMLNYYMPKNKDLYFEYFKCDEELKDSKLEFKDKVWSIMKCLHKIDSENFVLF
ncbi:uncharacterized protein [Diabrotica undecimpunctata]|uniref:uncharacterized protein n=1 Tax=Diabrotica undecimpunctata TaxID=50387 RepID=UPI003B63C7FA